VKQLPPTTTTGGWPLAGRGAAVWVTDDVAFRYITEIKAARSTNISGYSYGTSTSVASISDRSIGSIRTSTFSTPGLCFFLTSHFSFVFSFRPSFLFLLHSLFVSAALQSSARKLPAIYRQLTGKIPAKCHHGAFLGKNNYFFRSRSPLLRDKFPAVRYSTYYTPYLTISISIHYIFY